MAFKEQSQNWERITIGHVNSAILVVHDFIFKLLELVCPDARVRGQIRTVLSEEVLDGYRAALEHALPALHHAAGQHVKPDPRIQAAGVQDPRRPPGPKGWDEDL